MTTPVNIRRYMPEDTDRLLAIWLAASREGHPFLGIQRLEKQRDLVRDVYLKQAENWVAIDEDEKQLGFIGLLDNFIGGLFVDPALHRSGIGRTLVEHAVSLKGPLSLEVYALNKGARAFYKRLGFMEVGRRPQDDSGLPFELIRLTQSSGSKSTASG